MQAQHDPDSRPVPAGARRFAENIPKVLIGLAAFTTMAYVEEAIYTQSYLSEFGASWILGEVPMAIFYERSMIPLLLLLFFAFLAAMGVFDIEHTGELTSSKRFKTSVSVITHGPTLLIVLVATDFLLGTFGHTTLAVVMSAISATVLLLLCVSGLKILVVWRQKKDIRLDRTITYLPLTVIALGLYVVPAQSGSNFGKLDKDPTLSTLPTINLRDDSTEYKLLLSVDERLYLFPAHYVGEYPAIETTSAAKVEFIRYGNKFE